MPTVILDLASAMAASFDWSANAAEGLGLSLGVIDQAIVSWIKSAGDGQEAFDADGNPMAELHTLGTEMVAEGDVPFRQVIKKEGPAGLQDTNALIYPTLAPGEVFGLFALVVDLGTILLAEVKRRVGKNSINALGGNLGRIVRRSARNNAPVSVLKKGAGFPLMPKCARSREAVGGKRVAMAFSLGPFGCVYTRTF